MLSTKFRFVNRREICNSVCRRFGYFMGLFLEFPQIACICIDRLYCILAYCVRDAELWCNHARLCVYFLQIYCVIWTPIPRTKLWFLGEGEGTGPSHLSKEGKESDRKMAEIKWSTLLTSKQPMKTILSQFQTLPILIKILAHQS